MFQPCLFAFVFIQHLFPRLLKKRRWCTAVELSTRLADYHIYFKRGLLHLGFLKSNPIMTLVVGVLVKLCMCCAGSKQCCAHKQWK